jgi:hypothetical protein
MGDWPQSPIPNPQSPIPQSPIPKGVIKNKINITSNKKHKINNYFMI